MLNQTAVYALRIMGYVAAQNGRRVSGSEIAKEMDIPRNFLSKISHILSRAGLLDATRGVNGGFVLARRGDSIALADVAGLFMKLTDIEKCFLGLEELHEDCCIHHEWSLLMAHVRKFLGTRTVDEIMGHAESCNLEIPQNTVTLKGETE